jgi:hypothetical protein
LNTHVRDNLLAIPHPVQNENTTIDIVNSATEQVFYTYGLPADALGANGYLIAEVIGDILTNNTGTSGLFTLKMKIGASDFFTFSAAYADNPTRNTFHLFFFVINRGSTSSQIVRVEPGFPPPTTGSVSNSSLEATFDSTAGQIIQMSWQWNQADTQNSFRRLWSRTLLAKN